MCVFTHQSCCRESLHKKINKAPLYRERWIMIICALVIDRLTKGMFCSEIDWFMCDGTSNLKASELWTSVNWLECVITSHSDCRPPWSGGLCAQNVISSANLVFNLETKWCNKKSLSDLFKWTWQNQGPSSQIEGSMTEGGQKHGKMLRHRNKRLHDDIHKGSYAIDLENRERESRADMEEEWGEPSIRLCIHYHLTDLHIAQSESNGRGHTYWLKPTKNCAFYSLSLKQSVSFLLCSISIVTQCSGILTRYTYAMHVK